MKIDASRNPVPTSGVDTPKRAAKSAPQASSGSDVKISGFSSQIQALESQQGNSGPVDGSKVAAIKQAIAEGRFSINPGAIADSLISSAQELLQNKRPA